MKLATFLVAFGITVSLFACGLDAASSPFSWIRTQTLRDNTGQPSYNYSDAMSSYGNTLAVGSTSANRGIGQVTIFRDTGAGLRTLVVLTPPSSSGVTIGSQFGQSVLLFNYLGFLQCAVSAISDSSGAGSVYIYQQEVSNASLWDYIQVLTPPTGVAVIHFGRSLIYDGNQLLIGAEQVYPSGLRFEVTSINVIGTAKYIQSDGVEDSIGGDPIFIFSSVADRNNKTYLSYFKSIADTDYSLNTGASVAVSGDLMAVGASFREQLKYGSGTDGDLVVTGTKYLDGTASYNFNSITVRSGGTLTVDHYESLRNAGGIMSVKVKTLLYIEKGGAINVTAAGYVGGRTAFTSSASPQPGGGTGGGAAAASQFVGVYACDYSTTVAINVALSAASVSSFAVNQSLPFAEACGGGGSYGTKGTSGTKVACGTSGAAGSIYGDAAMTVMYRGSGGGSGFPWKVGAGGAGGNGGGIINIAAQRIINYGTIEANGGYGSNGGFFSGAGGGGSGGSVHLVGDNLANYGSILAKGGVGGVRAKGSGSGGDFTARGGNGGYGRIKFDFLQTQAHGIVIPRPVNVTTYLGDVLLYKRNATTKQWSLRTFIPRLPAFQFIGHSVALNGHLLAVASTQGTPVTPLEQVFLIDTNTVFNVSAASSVVYSVLNAPQPKTDLNFGYRIALNNNTLAVSAYGTADTRGVVYLYQDRDLLHHINRLTPVVILSKNPQPGDYFGYHFVLDFPKLYVQLPLSQDEVLNASTRRSVGCVPVYKYIRSPSAAVSYVTCAYSRITLGLSVNCTLHLFASDHYVAGDLVDMLYITPTVDFQSTGVYSFIVQPPNTGLVQVNATYNGTAVQPFILNVTAAIVPSLSSIACAPMVFTAGTKASCVITTNAGSGELIAANQFDVVVWNADDSLAAVAVGQLRVLSPFSILYRSPPSGFVFTAPNETDYRTLLPNVTYVSMGIYVVNFTTWRPGTYGVMGFYQNVPLRFPNPIIVDVQNAAINASLSSVTCPKVARPNRTLVCELQLMSSAGVPADVVGLESQLMMANNTVAGYRNLSVSAYPASAVYDGEGRYSVVLYPDKLGFFFVNVTVLGSTIPLYPARGVNISGTYPAACREYPRLVDSFAIFNQATQAHADSGIYGSSATNAAFSNGVGFCDQANV